MENKKPVLNDKGEKGKKSHETGSSFSLIKINMQDTDTSTVMTRGEEVWGT